MGEINRFNVFYLFFRIKRGLRQSHIWKPEDKMCIGEYLCSVNQTKLILKKL